MGLAFLPGRGELWDGNEERMMMKHGTQLGMLNWVISTCVGQDQRVDFITNKIR